MAKVLRCSDVGFECEGVIRAETEEEVMQQAAEHAKTVHDVQELTDEIVQKVKAAIQDEQQQQNPIIIGDHPWYQCIQLIETAVLF